MNFNSHAHEGRDVSADEFACLREISTHTPTRGVTYARILYAV